MRILNAQPPPISSQSQNEENKAWTIYQIPIDRYRLTRGVGSRHNLSASVRMRLVQIIGLVQEREKEQ